MSTRSGRERLWLAGVLFAPVLLVQGARLFMGPGTTASPAPAAAAVMTPPPEPAAVKPLTAKQQQALDYIRARAARASIIEGGPMDSAPAVAETEPVKPVSVPSTAVHPPTAQDRPKPPEAVLTAIVTGRNPLAVINGGVFKVGDEIAPGWRVQRIDPSGLTVTLVGPREATATIEQARSGD